MKCNNNAAVLGQYTQEGNTYNIKSKCILDINGRGNSVYIGNKVMNTLIHDELIYIHIYGDNNTVVIDDAVTYGKSCSIFLGQNSSFKLGSDCMLSNDIKFYVRDNEQIIIGEHVWFGLRSSGSSPLNIGVGSIVGANSCVTGSYSNNIVAVGNPALTLKTNIAWHRHRDEHDMYTLPAKYRQTTV